MIFLLNSDYEKFDIFYSKNGQEKDVFTKLIAFIEFILLSFEEATKIVTDYRSRGYSQVAAISFTCCSQSVVSYLLYDMNV